MKTLAVSRGLQILTGKLYIFIAKMTVELKDVSLVPSSCFNCCFMMIGIAFSLRSREARGWAEMVLFGLQPRSPQPRSAAHQHQLSLLVVATLFLSRCQERVFQG